MRVAVATGAIGLLLLQVGCDAEARACREKVEVAQLAVNGVDSKSIPSLRASLVLVEQAHAACTVAKLGTLRDQLLKAKHELSAQLTLLEQRAARKRKAVPTKAELALLVKGGDPSCPKGQAYQQRETKQEVRCTGPQLVEMSRDELKTYYGERRFKLTAEEAPISLKAELGSEMYVFTFEHPGAAAPRCITAFAAPGMSWQELTSRLTGAAPEKLKLDAPVRISGAELALKVEHADDQPTVRLGQCTGP